MKQVVITGGAGLIGRVLTNELTNVGIQVIVLSRHPDQVRELPAGARAEKWDGRTAQGWGALLNAETAIVNFAGESIGFPPVPWSAERKCRIRASRLAAGRAIVEAIGAANEKPGVLIQSSAVGYYGLCGDELVTEQEAAGKDFLAQIALDWEASTAEVEALGVRRAIIRTGVVLTLKGGALPLLALPFRFFAGGPMGSGKQYVPWIHIADEVGAIRFLIDNVAARGAYNLTAPNPLTNAELSHALGQALHRPAWLPVPGFALKMGLGEMAELLLLGGQRAVPQRLEQAGYVFRFAEAYPALQDLFR